MSLFGAFWDKDPNPVGTENFGNNKGLFHNFTLFFKHYMMFNQSGVCLNGNFLVS